MGETQAGYGKRNIKLDLEGRRGKHQTTDRCGVVMRPDADQHSAYALAENHHVIRGHTVARFDVPDKSIHVTY